MTALSIASIVRPILEASKSRKLVWEEDVTGGYMVEFGENTVNIYQTDHDIGYTITLRVLNADEKVVDFLDFDERRSDFSEAEELYAVVRRQVLGADKVLEDILERLNVAP